MKIITVSMCVTASPQHHHNSHGVHELREWILFVFVDISSPIDFNHRVAACWGYNSLDFANRLQIIILVN